MSTGAKNVDAVLFDLDGTLLDHDGATAAAITASFPDADAAFLVTLWSRLSDEAVDRYLAGELSYTGQRRARIVALARELGLGTWDADRADDWLIGYLRRYEAAWRPYADVRPALGALAGRAVLGVVTNGDAVQQRAKLARIGVAADLPYVLTSSEAGAAKPAPEIFLDACTALGTSPARTAYVGDRLAVDAVGATSAGLRGVWLDRSGDPPPEDLAVPRVTTLEELPALLVPS